MSLCLTLILNLVTALAWSQTSEGPTIDEIQWAPTGIRVLMLDNNITEKFCGYDSNRFKGCVAAVEKFGTFVHNNTEIALVNGQLALRSSQTRGLSFKKKQAYRRQQLNTIEKAFSPTLVKNLVNLYSQLRTLKPHPKPHEVALPLNEFLAIAYDPHMMYQPMFEHDGLNRIRQQPFIGIITEKMNQNIIIESVIVNSEAEKVGLKAGDIILKANDEDVVIHREEDLYTVLSFQPNEKVKLTVKRRQRIFDVEVVFGYKRRTPVVDRVITYKGKKYSYLHMAEVPADLDPEPTCRIFSNILKKMNEHSQGLILDLRGNIGGPGYTAACLTGLFVGKDKPIYIDQDMVLSGVNQEVPGFMDKVFHKKLVVLVNAKTVSSGELMTAGIQFYGRGLILGDRTFGKSIGQLTEALKTDKVDFYTTTSKAYRPDGTSYHGRGITPDFYVFRDGLKPNQNEIDAIREEDFALFPRKLEPIKASGKSARPLTFPLACATESSVRYQMDLLHERDWQKDFQLQYALRTLECM